MPVKEASVQAIMNSPVILAIVAAICYGLGGPLMKIAGQSGATPSGLCLMYALGVAMVCVNVKGPTLLFQSPRAILPAIAMGLLCGLASRAITRAVTLPSGQISVVLVISSCYPLLSSAIGLSFLGEASRVVLPKLAIGSLLIVGGVILVSTSQR